MHKMESSNINAITTETRRADRSLLGEEHNCCMERHSNMTMTASIPNKYGNNAFML